MLFAGMAALVGNLGIVHAKPSSSVENAPVARLGGAPGRTAIAFINVNVLPMDRERVLQHQTVRVADGKIVSVKPAGAATIPAGTKRIDARGEWLLPGLADMHVHVQVNADLALFIANGVTTVLHMGLAPSSMVDLDREDIESGKLVGPQMFFGFIVDGSPRLGLPYVSTPEEARAMVQFAKANRYNYIKVYNNLSPQELAAIVQESQRLGMAVIGHGVRSVGLPAALARGR
jgi:cytosine/adenosine deaminase-related metal-dependent hydrolase